MYPIFLVVFAECFLHVIVQKCLGLAFLRRSKIIHDILHGYDCSCREAVFLLNLIQCGNLPLQTDLHTVQRNHQSENLHICLCAKNRNRLRHRRSGGGNVLNDHHAVSIAKLTSKKDSGVPVILDLLTVCAVTDVHAVYLTDGHHRGHCKRNALIGRSEQNVKIQTIRIMNGSCIILTETDQLSAVLISTCIHEERRLASAL